jgi:hypothetical protein
MGFPGGSRFRTPAGEAPLTDSRVYEECVSSPRTQVLFTVPSLVLPLLLTGRGLVAHADMLSLALFPSSVISLFCAVSYRTLTVFVSPEALNRPWGSSPGRFLWRMLKRAAPIETRGVAAHDPRLPVLGQQEA